MKVDQKGHTTIIRNTQYSTSVFLEKFLEQYITFKEQNLILDLTHDKEISLDDVKKFKDLVKTHAKHKKSMVLVSDEVDFNKVPAQITLVPSILEAHDIIEMEEIERDLGF